ncbi:hypothetical protein BRC85_05400 [Halobacteriales archaeon QS_1_69_70]|nr:MAG: hypothetical protein BRC85_05400 [Halobacteriales archaeon QS_1_69_70]
MADEPVDPSDVGEVDAPPVSEAPHEIIFASRDHLRGGRVRRGRPVSDSLVHVADRHTDEEIAPDPAGDGTLSIDW